MSKRKTVYESELERRYYLDGTLKIEVAPRGRGLEWHAQLKDQPGKWGAGRSIDEAIGNLVQAHYEDFNIGVKFVNNIR